jgi:hypothetical protein
MVDLSLQVIRFGTITRFVVRRGEIGLGWENNQPVFFDGNALLVKKILKFFLEGVYEKDSPMFAFEKCVAAADKVISLGAKKIVTVWDGEVGVSYLRGKLVVSDFFQLEKKKSST